MSFKVTKKLDLSDLGEGWQGAYLDLQGLSFREIRELTSLSKPDSTTDDNFEAIEKLIQSHFISGKAWDGSNLVDVTKDNVLDLPLDVVANKAVKLLAGTSDPK
jgi:hypothetical protein